MRRAIRYVHSLILLFAVLFPIRLDAQEPPFSIKPFISIVSSAKIYTSPFSLDIEERNTTIDLDAFATYGAALSWAFSGESRLEISAEYLETAMSRYDNNKTEIRDGFRAAALEICPQFILPFSSRRFRLCIGGGAGIYIAVRRSSIAGIQAKADRSHPSMGILVSFGAEYVLSRHLAVNGEVRYRDPQIDTRNAFPQSNVLSNGILYPLEQRPFDARVNIDGTVYRLAIAYRF
ncbi:MAG: hypothetical protein QHI48_00575 [Bacteroidota bacterium]|nr:hypothetical protein [Bacteroidota bacterium]